MDGGLVMRRVCRGILVREKEKKILEVERRTSRERLVDQTTRRELVPASPFRW
jgi:hypothetical protein